MSGSIVPYAIDRLVAILGAVSGLTVFDGPGVTDDAHMDVLCIGWTDPETTGMDEAATLNQSWPYLGHAQRDEVSDIHCVATAWNGDADMKAARDKVFSYLTAIGSAIEADPSLGFNDAPVAGIQLLVVAGITVGTFTQNQDDTGAIARIVFTIQIKGRVN